MLMNKPMRRRYISEEQISRDQALWLGRAILTHYRSDGLREDGERDFFDVLNRTHKSQGYKRGRDWVVHPVGYDLNEIVYGTESSGIREAWATLVALPVSRSSSNAQEYRTFQTYGLVAGNHVNIAIYKITEVTITSSDNNFIQYVRDCFARIVDDVEEIPEYVAKKKTSSGKRQDESMIQQAAKRNKDYASKRKQGRR